MTKKDADIYWSYTTIPICIMFIMGCWWGIMEIFSYITSGTIGDQWYSSPIALILSAIMFWHSSMKYDKIKGRKK